MEFIRKICIIGAVIFGLYNLPELLDLINKYGVFSMPTDTYLIIGLIYIAPYIAINWLFNKNVKITKDTPRNYSQTSLKPKSVVTNRKLKVIKKSPQTILGKKREINKQLKNGLITKRTADSRIKKVIEAEKMNLIIKNINTKPNKKKVKSTTKLKPKIKSINDDDLVSSETLDLISEMGFPVREVMYQDALSLLKTDLERAFSFALKSADMGYDEAQILVGSMHLHGQGTTKNIDTGKEWLSKAAQSSNKDVSERAKGIIEQIPITQLIDPEILENMDPKWFK